MINKNILHELNRLGFGADIDSLENYIINSTRLGNNEDEYKRLLKQLKPESAVFMGDYLEEQVLAVQNNASILDVQVVNNMEDILGFKSRLGEEITTLSASILVEGVGVVVTYNFGRLERVFTGVSGEAINLKDIVKPIIPKVVSDWKNTEEVKVKGILTVKKDIFDKIVGTYKTVSNYVSYVINDEYGQESIDKIDMLCYECSVLLESTDYENEHDIDGLLGGAGFNVIGERKLFETNNYSLDETIEDILHYFETVYNDLDYIGECIYVATGNDKFILKMGRLWESNQYSSIIESIEWISSADCFKPIAHIKPVITVTGDVVERVPLHGVSVIERNKLHVGSTINFIYKGVKGIVACDEGGKYINNL